MKHRIRFHLILTLLVLIYVNPFAPYAAAASNPADEFDALRAKMFTYFTGGNGYDPNDPDISVNIKFKSDAVSNENLTGYWDTMNKAANRSYLWADLQSTTKSSEVSSHFTRLNQMALAYSTIGSPLYHNVNLKNDIVSGLDWAYANRYKESKSEYDNWWDWEIGTPQLVNSTLVLMYEDLTQAQIDNYMRAIDRFVPNPSKRTASSVVETGANLLDKAYVVSLRGVIGKSSAKITQGRDSMSPAFLYVKSGDGFYEDGSFIQHTYVAYTGGYGDVLLGRMADLMYLLSGSSWSITDPNVANVYRWVDESYKPLIYMGASMDNLKGRGITRQSGNDHTTGRSIILSMLRLAEGAPAEQALKIKRMVKEWISTDTTFANYYTGASMFDMILGKKLMSDGAITPQGKLVGQFQFPGMDRVAQLREHFGLGISMFSPRISAFEYGNGENIKGWFTGVGMTTLYNNDLKQYSDNYWATVNMYRLPGTTTDGSGSGTPVDWKNYANPNTWVGGSSVDQLYGSAGMQFSLSQNTGSPLQGKKSWFMFGDQIVAVGSGIASTDTARTVETIVENRKLNASGDNPLIVDGVTKASGLGWSETINNANWAHLSGNVPGSDIGYYFPGTASITGLRESRSGTWKQINTGGNTDLVTNSYLSLAFHHGKAPANATYAYVVLPGKDAAATASYAANPDIQILENSADAHAVIDSTLHAVGANFWNDVTKTVYANNEPLITSDKKASVTMLEADGEIHIGISDPTKANTGTIQVELNRSAAGVLSLDPGITVTQVSPTIKLSVRTNGASGKTLAAKFSMKAPSTTETPVLVRAEGGASQVVLSWTGVQGAAGYRVKYGTSSGVYTKTLDVTSVSSTNQVAVTGLETGRTYYFAVAAYQASGESGLSNELSATPVPIVTIFPEADVYVRDGSYAGTNYGTADTLVTKQDAAGYVRQSYLRFDLASISGAIESAKVTLVPVGVSMSGTTNQAQLVADNSWGEAAVNWNNKPAAGAAFATWTLTSAYTPAQFDVTKQVHGALAADKKMSLLIASTSNQGAKGDISYASREHANAAYRPVLEVTLSTPPAALSTELSGGSTAASGETFKVTVGLKNLAQPAFAQDVTLNYDANAMEFVSATSMIEGVSILEPIRQSAGKLRLFIVSKGASHAISEDAQVVELTFRAKAVTENKTGNVEISKAVLGDSAGGEAEAAASSYRVAIVAPIPGIPGDLTNDRKVTIGDLAIVAAHYGKDTNSPDWEEAKKADVIGDGHIDIDDLAFVAAKIIQ
ncbi:polysaccharide lyase family 8 super-sandwich domain-containing protein [Paenibacillus chondroitinus]|uniref:Polysaccharide lyase family 8 super-sandwich domain-containing protein n=1 Tax=Paenibacillus chondroitinus TaxID=59842 RepID=A0ABU6D9L0_9BACL|nr:MULTISPECIES: polysaccharide lyase family 8 super-sandwich domain-containing protein [Paenibacillus]MCY9656781.1 DNRLRE domain-containing protein [Paenibacillus anseongense]MEB4794430.1 polysaccharide lyase family 8 super-sandwich domain-containing protein [Paenibacillus chondroitinus]